MNSYCYMINEVTKRGIPGGTMAVENRLFGNLCCYSCIKRGRNRRYAKDMIHSNVRRYNKQLVQDLLDESSQEDDRVHFDDADNVSLTCECVTLDDGTHISSCHQK